MQNHNKLIVTKAPLSLALVFAAALPFAATEAIFMTTDSAESAFDAATLSAMKNEICADSSSRIFMNPDHPLLKTEAAGTQYVGKSMTIDCRANPAL